MGLERSVLIAACGFAVFRVPNAAKPQAASAKPEDDMADWYYARDGQQAGPVQFAELQAMAARGQLAASDLVWTEGLTQWQPAWQVQELFPAAGASPFATQPGYASP